ncbi:MAG: hypothetical protein AAF153_01290 [Pseudomonadota bacterium]
MKYIGFIFTIIALLNIAACGGRSPNLIQVNQYGDNNRSCTELEHEMDNIQNEIQRLLPKSDKTGKNVALGVAGAFLLVPWFFMDFKNAELQEYEAYRMRYNHLSTIASGKHCTYEKANIPSISEMKQEIERLKAERKAN